MRQSRLANRIEGRRQGFKERKLIMNKTIKMLVAGMSAAVLAIVLIACGGQKQGTGADVAPETSVETEADPSATVGGWTLPSAISSTLTAEERAIFDKAVEGITGVGYDPVAVIATQVVSGTNRAYLCRGTLVTPGGGQCWYIVTVYENLQGDAEIREIKEFDFSNPIFATGEADGMVLGGWQIVEPSAVMIPADAAEALAKASEGTLGYEYTPIALLGTQLVSGTNYRILAYGAPVSPDAQGTLHVLDVYMSLDGTAELTGMGALDITAYV